MISLTIAVINACQMTLGDLHFVSTEDTCLRDESPICPIVAEAMMCGSDFAMGNNGLRCCVSCMGMAGGD